MTTPNDIAGPADGITVSTWGGDDADTFVMVHADVLDALTGRGQLLSVYMALRRKMTPDRMDWWGTRQDMADLAGVSVRAWDRAVKELEEMGLVRSTPRFVPKAWRGDLAQVSPRRSQSHPVQISNNWELRVHLPEYYVRRSLATPPPGEATRGRPDTSRASAVRPEGGPVGESPGATPSEPQTATEALSGDGYSRRKGEMIQAEHDGQVFMLRSTGDLDGDLRAIEDYKRRKDREAEERRQFELQARSRPDWREFVQVGESGAENSPPKITPGMPPG